VKTPANRGGSWRHPACVALLLGIVTSQIPAPRPTTFAEFRTLSWVEGTWRGTDPTWRGSDPNTRYERYHFVNNSTIAVWTFRDSTVQPDYVMDTAWVGWRAGVVTYQWGRYRNVLTQLDSAGATFASVVGNVAISWTRAYADNWTVTLKWTSRSGTKRERPFAMVRWPMH
jgi:hypothetical protein